MTGAPAAWTTATSRAGSIVPVSARAELVPRVVAVHQVDPAGDGLDPVHDPGKVLPGRVRVAGVQAEADLAAVRVADRVPEPGQVVQAPRHRAVTAGRVLDQHRQRPADALDRLAPAAVAIGRVGARGD